DDYARAVTQPVRKDRLLKGATIYVEPGRGLVGRAAVALYRVVGTKRVPDVRTFVAVDGGMGDNIRPALYGAEYSAVLAARAGEQPAEEVTVAGRYCESGDILIRSVRLPTARSGDVLAIPGSGEKNAPSECTRSSGTRSNTSFLNSLNAQSTSRQPPPNPRRMRRL